MVSLFQNYELGLLTGLGKLGLLKIGAYHTLFFGGYLKKPYLCIVKK